ncbi:unnamed protein product [Knipowitschia caucasica]|uniref:Gamma-interferon-inducible lysosomal thiol reductase n=1 Tax=Knipowitschia caucasica TaxID=637954 RepID=A0AAV2JTZ5_KNICA
MRAVLLLLLPVWMCSGAGRLSGCSRSSWCSSPEVAARCGVLKRCQKGNSTWLPQSPEPVKVEVFYETLCPDCIDFMTHMLYPSSVLLRDVLDLTVVPYGNARESFDGQRYIFSCQHGEQECLGNMIQACVLNMVPAEASIIVFCMEAAADVVQAAQACVELYAPQLPWDRLADCVKGDLGNQLMHENAKKTKALSPPHTSVPWVTVDGVHTEELQEKALSSLVSLVCSKYQGPKPAVCG